MRDKRIKQLEDYKNFLIMWYNRCPGYIDIQLKKINKELLNLQNNE